MFFYGSDTDAEALADLFAGGSFGNQFQNFPFTIGQSLPRTSFTGEGGLFPHVPREHFVRDHGAQVGVSPRHTVNSCSKFFERRLFEEISGGSCVKGSSDDRLRHVNRENQTLDSGMGKFCLADDLGSMHAGQRQIQKNDIRLKCSDQAKCIGAVPCCADDKNLWIEG